MTSGQRHAAGIGLMGLAMALGAHAMFGIESGPLPRPVAPAQTPTPAPVPEVLPPPPQATTSVPPPTVGLLPEPRPYRAPRPSGENVLPAEQVYAAAAPNVACVSYGPPDAPEQASGFLFGSAGSLLTVLSSVPAENLLVSVGDAAARPARLIWRDPVFGLSIVAPATPVEGTPLALAPEAALAPGTVFLGLACAPGLGIVAQTGAVGASEDDPLPRVALPLDAAFVPGSAGGPLLDRRGRVAGIAVSPGAALGAASAVVPIATVVVDLLRAGRDASELGLTASDLVAVGVVQADPALALRAFRASLELEPGALLPTYNMGVAAARLPPTRATALAAYRQVRRLDPAFTDASLNLALLLEEDHDAAGAARILEDVVTLTPQDATAWATLGEIYRRAGDLPRAETALRRALAANPATPQAHYNLGVLYGGIPARRAEARAAFQRFVQLAPDAPSAPTVGAFVAGATLPENGAEARHHLHRAEPETNNSAG